MKNITYITMFFLLFSGFLYSQTNLIPNPSFEDKNGCSNNITFYSYDFNQALEHWKATDEDPYSNNLSFNNTPEYYNICATDGFVGVPQNFFGYQEAKDGNAYVGIGVGFTTVPLPKDKAEYIFTELTEPLEANEVYTFSMYASKADIMPFSVNQLGAMFVDELPFADSTPNAPISEELSPQILELNVISDTENWTKIEGVFTAQGGEQYVIIGHFYNPQTSIFEGVEDEQENDWNTYYYIDDVSLRKGNLSNIVFNEKEIRIYPNPSDNQIFIEGITPDKIKTATLFDTNGRKIAIHLDNNTMDISNLTSGIYILNIETKDGSILSEKLVKK